MTARREMRLTLEACVFLVLVAAALRVAVFARDRCGVQFARDVAAIRAAAVTHEFAVPARRFARRVFRCGCV